MSKIKGMKVLIDDESKDAMVDRIRSVLDSGFLMWGDQQDELADRFTDKTGKDHGVTFASCTTAVEVLMRYLRQLGAGTVAMQANQFPSPVFAAIDAGLEVRFTDIDPELLTSNRWPVDVDIWYVQWTGGFMVDHVEEMRKEADRRGIVLIEDCSHASGTEHLSGRWAGAFGHHAVWSLAGTKPLQTGQGGMLCTDDPELAQFAFESKNYGRDQMFQKGVYVRHGSNLHMTELQAAVGNVLFDAIGDSVEHRQKVAGIMTNPLVDLGRTVLGNWQGSPNCYKVPVLMESADEAHRLTVELAARDIELGSKVYDFVTPKLGVFNGAFADFVTPLCDDFAARHVCLPVHMAVTVEDAHRVADAIREVL